LQTVRPNEQAKVPELKVYDVAHRACFHALMEGMGGTAAHAQKQPEKGDKDDKPEAKDDKPKEMPKDAVHGEGAPEMPSADRVYTVQVIWDETMADGAAKWLAAHPHGHVIILAG